jgi:hypothetical protein
MPATQRLQFTTTIHAPVASVWHAMIDPIGYQTWTAAFTEGSRFEGSWAEGEKILFLAPSGEGMVSEIAERREHAFISIRHLGMIAGGVEDTSSDAVRAWAPAYENYSFTAVPEGTQLVIDIDVADAWLDYMQDTWPKALALLKGLCERKALQRAS